MRSIGLAALVATTLVSANALAADFSVQGTFPTWTINGQANPTLTLTRGQTYTFDVQAPGHPFDIKTAQVTGTADQFTTGVTGEGVTSGTLTFVVPTDPTTPPLFYQCEVHSSMTGVIQLVNAAPAPSGTRWTLAALMLALGAAGFIAFRRKGSTPSTASAR
jgi:hypothetical protein